MLIKETLKERGEIYGDYGLNVESIASIMNILQKLHHTNTGETMNLIDYSNLNYIVIKLVRLGVTPEHIDSWHDISGYAKLIEDYYDV